MLSDNHDRVAVEKRRAADEGLIVFKLTIAVQLLKTIAHGVDVIEGVGAFRVPGDLDLLPRRQMRVDFETRGLDL